MFNTMRIFNVKNAVIRNAREFKTTELFYVADLAIESDLGLFIVRMFSEKPFTNMTILGSDQITFEGPESASIDVHNVTDVVCEKRRAVDDSSREWQVVRISMIGEELSINLYVPDLLKGSQA